MITPAPTPEIWTIDAYLVGHRKRRDGSYQLSFETQEVVDTISLAHIITTNPNMLGKLAFAQREYQIQPEDVEAPEAIPKETKTPSQRLRSVLFVWWSQHKPPAHPTFETFYEVQMNRLIEKTKEGLQ